MKRLLYEILTIFNPVEEDKRRRMGNGEYFASKGIGNDIDDNPPTMQGTPVIKLSKHLQKI